MLGSRNSNKVLVTLVETMITTAEVAPADLLDRQEKLVMGKAEIYIQNHWIVIYYTSLHSLFNLDGVDEF
jgi:hypothetical protein